MNKQHSVNAGVKAEGKATFVNSGPLANMKDPVPKVGTVQPGFVPVVMPNQTFTRVSQGTESVGQGPARFLTPPGSSVSPVIMSNLPVLQNTRAPVNTKFMAGCSTASVIGQTLPVMQCVSMSSFAASNAVQVMQNQPTQNIQIVQNQPSASASVLQNSLTSNIQILPQNAIQVITAPSPTVEKNNAPSNQQIMHQQPSLLSQPLNAMQVMTALSQAVKKNMSSSNPQIMHPPSLQNVSQNAKQKMAAPSKAVKNKSPRKIMSQPSLQNQSQNAVPVMSAPSAQPSSNSKLTQQPRLQIIQSPSGQLQLVPVEQAPPANFSNSVSILKRPHAAGKKRSGIKKEFCSDVKSGVSDRGPAAANPILNNLLKKVRGRIENNRKKKSSSVAKDESSKTQTKQLPSLLPKVPPETLTSEELFQQHQEIDKKQPDKKETETKTSEVKDADKDDDKPVVIIKDQHRENVEDKITFAGTSVKPKFAIEFSPNNLQAYVQAVANAAENHKTLSEQSKLELKIKRKKVSHKYVEEDSFWVAEVPKETVSAPKASRRKQTLAVRKDPFDGCEIVVEPFKRLPRKRKKVTPQEKSPVNNVMDTSSQTNIRLHNSEEDEVDAEIASVPDPKVNQKEKSPPREVGVFIPPTMTKSISPDQSFQPQYLVKDKQSINSSSSSSPTSTISGSVSSSQKSEESVLPVPLNEIKTEPLEKEAAPSNVRPTHVKNVQSNDKTTKKVSMERSTCESLCPTSVDTDASRDPCPEPVTSIKVEVLSSGYESSCRKIIKKSLNFGSEVERLKVMSHMPSPLPEPMSPNSKLTPIYPWKEMPKVNVPLSSPEQASVDQSVGQEPTLNPSSVTPASLHTNSSLSTLIHRNSLPITSLHPKSVQQSKQHCSALNQTMVKRVTKVQNKNNSVVTINNKLPDDKAENRQFPLLPSEQNSVGQTSPKRSTELLGLGHLTAVQQTKVEHVTVYPKVTSLVTGTGTKLPEGTASEKNKISTTKIPQLAANTTIFQDKSLLTNLGSPNLQSNFLTSTGTKNLSQTAKLNTLHPSAPVHVIQPTLSPTILPPVNSNVSIPMAPLFSSSFMQVPLMGVGLKHVSQEKKVYVVPSSLYTALVAQANSGKPVQLSSAQFMAAFEQNSTGAVATPKTTVDASNVMLVKKHDETKSPLIPIPVSDLLSASNNTDVCDETDKGLMELKIDSVFSLNKVCCKLMDKVPSYLDMCLNSKLEHSLKLCFVVLDDRLPPVFRGKAGTKRTRFKMPKICSETCRTQALDSMCVNNQWRNIQLDLPNSEPVSKVAKQN